MGSSANGIWRARAQHPGSLLFYAGAAVAEETEDVVELIRRAPEGWVREIGLVVEAAAADRVVASLEILPRHWQGYGIVHGGVYSSIVETLCSIGAHLYSSPGGRAVAGLENHTSFIRSIREGRVTAVAVPLAQGRRSQVWQCDVRDQEDRLVASGRVRLHVFDPGDLIAGERPKFVRG
jgi:1,4-dihydroxy-2-naphthoyl-CoA hydrolase